MHVELRVDAAHVRSVPTSAAVVTADADARPLRCIYQLVRDSGLDPVRPAFVAVPAHARFERLLAHAHPFDMDGHARRRRFMEALLAVAGRVDVWECRFAPSLAALPALARALRAHMEAS